MQEDYRLTLSLGYIHACCLWAHEQINMETHGDFVRTNFSGVLCIDAVYDSGRTILFATDPLGDFMVSFQVGEKNDQDHMDTFLQALTERGLHVPVAITDGSPLYKDSLQRYWADIAHQLCIFQVIKEVHKLILDGVRAIKNRLKRQGNKGGPKRRGRPSKKAQKQRPCRQGMRKKEPATCIWDHQCLIVRKQAALGEQEKEDLALMLKIAPELKLFRQCNQQFYRLFARGISKPCARSRRRRLVNQVSYPANAVLTKALKEISTDKFANMIVFLGWEKGTPWKKPWSWSSMPGCWSIRHTRTTSEKLQALAKKQPSCKWLHSGNGKYGYPRKAGHLMTSTTKHHDLLVSPRPGQGLNMR
jgi:hypothetical protein